MDLSSLLPLLMRGNEEGDKTKLLSALMPKNGKSGEIMQLMELMNKNKKNDKRPMGLAPIKNIAPDEILGAMLKYYT